MYRKGNDGEVDNDDGGRFSLELLHRASELNWQQREWALLGMSGFGNEVGRYSGLLCKWRIP